MSWQILNFYLFKKVSEPRIFLLSKYLSLFNIYKSKPYSNTFHKFYVKIWVEI